MKNTLDQFYTKPSVALNLCKLIKEKVNVDFDKYTFLEPSAGFGSFVDALKDVFTKPQIIALDLDPKSFDITECDFFNFNTTKKHIFTIGNPPFGKRARLAMDFFNHASNFSDYIAFIVPLQFEKWSVQKSLNKDFKLLFSKILDAKSFISNGKDYSVRCCFQIWTKLPCDVDLRLKEAPPTTHKDFQMWQYNNTPEAKKYFDKQKYKWNFAVARQGFYDYGHFIIQENELNPKVQYIFFKANNEQILQNLKSLDFGKLSHKNTTIPGFGKADVIAEYKRVFK